LNRNYRLIWSHHLNSIVAVAENVRGQGKSGSKARTIVSAVASALLALGNGAALAADQTISTNETSQVNVGTVVAGSGNLTITGSVIFGPSASAGNVLLDSAVTGSLINQGTIGGTLGTPAATVGIWANGGSLSGSLINSGTISAVNAAVKIDNASSVGGNVSNSGQIEGFGYWSLYVGGNSTVAGRIENSGTIANLAPDRSIAVESSTVLGGVTNSGLLDGRLSIVNAQIGTSVTNANILNTGSIAGDVFVGGGTVHGSILNQAGTVSGVLNVDGAIVDGSIINSGSLEGQYGGLYVRSNAVIGGRITNSGTIHGLSVLDGGVVQQGVTNTGLIHQDTSSAFFMYAGTINGGVTNSGSIMQTGSSSAMHLAGGSLINGGLTNSGTISSLSSSGIFIDGATINGGLINSGTISGVNSTGFAGIAVYDAPASLSVFNSGTITGGLGMNVAGTASYSTSGDAPSVTTLTGSINNSGLIEGGTESGIRVSGAVLTGNIVNTGSGTIIGATHGIEITQRSYDLYDSASSLVGSGTLDSAVQGGITNSGHIEGAEFGILVDGSVIDGQISNLQGGTVTAAGLNGYPAGEGAITIRNGATVTGGINNAGLIDRGSAGSAIQIGNSLLQDGITNTGTIASSGAGIRLGDGFVSDLVGSTITGGILNAAGATISGDDGGISAERIAGANPFIAVHTLSGGITNRGLITSSNSEAVRLGSMLIDTVVNDTAGTLSGSRGLFLSYSTVTGNVINRGLINGNTSGLVVDNTTVAGSVLNTGRIVGQYGILLSSATISGGLTNTGTITGSSQGIYFGDGEVVANITNSGTIHGDEAGFYLSSSTLSGSITNQAGGVISGGTEGGIWLYESSVITGSINNAGTILGLSAPGIFLSSESSIGGITNSGLIRGDGGAGIFVSSSSLITGAIVNNAGGTISGSQDGIRIYSSSLVGNGITNSGLIEGDARDGIRIDGSASFPSTITGNITNLSGGRILGAVTGVTLSEGLIDGAINNAAGATISGGTIGIKVGASSTISDGITNAGLISATANSLDLNNSANAFNINNSGTLSGDADIGINTLNLNGNSARVIGDTGGSGDVNVNGTFTSEGAFNVGLFNVNTGGLFNMNHDITATTVTVNAGGTLNVGNATRNITGDYLQTGIYRMGLVDTTSNYGVLNVSGNANVAGGVDVVISGSPTVTNGTTVAGVIRSTGMTVTPADIVVTDNNLFINFTAATVSNPGNDLDLIVGVDSNALPNAVSPDNPSATGVAQALQDIYNAGAPAGFQPVFDALAGMSPEELNEALLQLTPSLQGAAAQAGINALHSMNKIIQSRVESVQGLNSGDEATDQFAWARVFGNRGDQDDLGGVPGFESRTHGLALGMDKPISDRIRAGGLVTYARTNLESNLGNTDIDVDTYEIAGYGSYNIDPRTDINVQLDLGLNKADSARRIGFMGTTAKADFDSFNYHLSAGIGRLFQLSDATNLTPSVRFDYTHVKTEGYKEHGAGVLNLDNESNTFEEFLLTADAKLSHKLSDDGFKFVANGSVGYDFINEQASASSTFVGGGTTFVTEGLDPSPWIYRGGLGLVKETGTGLEFSARYDAEWRSSEYLTQTASVKVRWAF